MKKQYLTVLFTLVCVLGLRLGARAQEEDTVVANVPFDFVIAGKILPAGAYRWSRVNTVGNSEPRKQKMEFIMKAWLLALSAVLLALSYAAPQSFSQDQRSASPTDQNSSSSTAQSSPAAAAPAVEPADPDKVRHNGGKADVDAIGDRNVGCKTGVGNWYGVEKQIVPRQTVSPAGRSGR